jgi:hypothetical protein
MPHLSRLVFRNRFSEDEQGLLVLIPWRRPTMAPGGSGQSGHSRHSAPLRELQLHNAAFFPGKAGGALGLYPQLTRLRLKDVQLKIESDWDREVLDAQCRYEEGRARATPALPQAGWGLLLGPGSSDGWGFGPRDQKSLPSAPFCACGRCPLAAPPAVHCHQQMPREAVRTAHDTCVCTAFTVQAQHTMRWRVMYA